MAAEKTPVAPSSAGEKVTIACKIAVAWLELELSNIREVSENTQTGPRTIKMGFRTGEIVRIRGTAYPVGQTPVGFPAKPEMANGYALTHNVSKDFWEKWLSQHQKDPMIMNRMIFAQASAERVRDETKDYKELASGLEPMNPKGDPRSPKSNDPNLTEYGTEEGFAKKLSSLTVEQV